MKVHFVGTLLLALGSVMFATIPVQASETVSAAPKHFAKVNPKSRQRTSLDTKRLLTANPTATSASHVFTLQLDTSLLELKVTNVIQHANGDLSFSQQFEHQGESMYVIYTQGKGVGLGELIGAGQHLYFEQRGDELYTVDLNKSGLLPGSFHQDTFGQPVISPQLAARSLSNVEAMQTVDIMLLFTPNIRDTYPGEMTATLLNQLTMKANQAFVDSGISVQLRLVHTQFVDYSEPSDFSALNDLAFALEFPDLTNVHPALVNVAELRETFGVDLIAMIRTHELNEREVCGVARFPDESTDILINISNVGISGGSNCINTFTHEIGHNFGAGHQQVDGQSVGALNFSGALIQRGKFNTIMSSIGTGDVNRDYKLNQFSNPANQCGAVQCGDGQSADNARTVNEFAAFVAGLRDPVSNVDVVAPEVSDPDRDGDGVTDSQDAFPFDASETADSDFDDTGDNQDAFPFDASETLDTDMDGVGNNQDTDDDNDGVADTLDDLPLDETESVDADGDGIGANSDALDNNFQEFMDSDLDGQGDIADLDDDNDGVADFSVPDLIENTELWVANKGSHNVVRFDAQSGDVIDTLIQFEQGGFSFRTDLLLSSAQQLYFIAFSDVYSYDRQSGQIRNAIDRSQLQTNFPAHLIFQGPSNLIVNNGLGTSRLQNFSLTNSGNQESSQGFSPEVLRGMVIIQNQLLVLARNTNQILAFELNNLGAAPQVFAQQSLNKPEHIASDSNSNLYVTNAGTGSVSKFDSSGTFLSVLIPPGRGGLGIPGCLEIGPDDQLYVCSTDTNQILKFDADSGAFLETLIDSSLDSPVGMVFAGKALDELPYSGDHDSDLDGVNNDEDDLPLDPSETVDTDGDGIGNNQDSDDDGDGMPDSFENDNGLDPLNAADANEDTDNDGRSNLVEFQAGTDPNVADTPAPAPTPPPPSSGGGGSLFGPLIVLIILARVRRQLWSKNKL